MKSKFVFSVCVLVAFLTPACAFHFPYDWGQDEEGCSVVMKVTPDDAEVLLNGKLIGYAYEFSKWSAALRLSSRHNELVVRKAGLGEETIDLSQYRTRRVSLQFDLTVPKPGQPVPADAKSQEAYIAKSESVKPLKGIEPAEKELAPAVPVALAITPAEAAIYVNGQFWGVSPDKGRIENQKWKPGAYVIEVFKAGYKPQKKEITLAKDKIEITISLEKQ
jgi:hypothetical protein